MEQGRGVGAAQQPQQEESLEVPLLRSHNDKYPDLPLRDVPATGLLLGISPKKHLARLTHGINLFE
jgi:hypothetical protein